MPRKIKLSSTFLNEGIETKFVQSDLKKNEQYIFNYRSAPDDQAVCNAMRQYSRLDTLFDVMTGAKPYQVGKGIPPQTKEIVKSKPYTGNSKKDDSWIPYIRGRSIDRYTNKWKGKPEYIKYGEWLAEPRSADVFKGEKIFVRQTGDCLIATYDKGNVSNNTLHSIYPLKTNNNVSLYYLLGLINSKLINWYYQIVNYLEMDKPMAEVKGTYIRELPIAIGTQKEILQVETLVEYLLEICQLKYNKNYDFIHFISKAYEPQKITEKLSEFEKLTFKEFLAELKKVKVKINSVQQKDLLGLYEDTVKQILDIDESIKKAQGELDSIVFRIYKIPENIIKKIVKGR